MRLPRRMALSLRMRFILGMGVMLLPLVVLAAIALLAFQSVTNAIDDVVQEAKEESSSVLRLELLIQQAMIVAHDALAQGLAEPLVRERLAEAHRGVRKAFEDVAAGPFALAEERALIRSAHEEWRQGEQFGETLLANPRPQDGQALLKDMERAHAHHSRALEMLDQVHTLSQQEMNAQLAYAISLRRGVLFGIASVFVVGLGIAIGVGAALTRSILTPLRALQTAANRFGTGDLSHRVALAGQEELARVGRTFNLMADRLAQSQAALRELSTRDSLTGLINYREFQRHLRDEVERYRRYGRPFSLLMVDVDSFKEINDTHGHPAGDEALRALALVLQEEIRPTDVVGRYGGEEFVMLLPETAGSGALTLAERLRSRVAGRAVPLTADRTTALTVSIGLAVFPEDADSAQKLLSAADRALYAAKSGGRNRVCRSGAS